MIKNIAILRCSLCKVACSSPQSLYKHIRKCHDRDEAYWCEHCQYAAIEEKEISLHMTVQHKNIYKYKCDLCTFQSSHMKILKDHLLSHGSHNGENQTAKLYGKSVLFKCSECGYSHSSRKQMRHHIAVHHRPDEHAGNLLSSDKIENAEKILDENSQNNAAPPRKDEISEKTGMMYNCSECNFVCQQASKFMEHLTEHKHGGHKSGDSNSPSVGRGQEGSVRTAQSAPMRDMLQENYTKVQMSNMCLFKCLICGYFCEHQRSIKSHIWKHSGHKDIDYPIFQNGPLSVYDKNTPVGTVEMMQKEGKSVIENMSLTDALTSGSTEEIIMPQIPDEHYNCVAKEIEVASIVEVESDSRTQAIQVDKLSGNSVASTDCELPCDGVSSEIQNIIPDHHYATNYKAIRYSEPAAVKEMKSRNVFTLKRKGAPIDDKLCPPPKHGCSEKVHKSVIVQNVSPYEAATQSQLTPHNDAANDEVCWEHERDSYVESAAQTLTELGSATPEMICHTSTTTTSTEQSTNGNDTDSDRSSVSVSDSTTKPQKGISRTLLAVIEHLRERTLASNQLTSVDTIESESEDTPVDVDVSNIKVEHLTEDEVLYRCQVCHYTNVKLALLKVHMKQHRARDPKQCPLCSYVGTSPDDLQQHALQHCYMRVYHCQRCSAKFHYKSQLRAHTRAHEELDICHVPEKGSEHNEQSNQEYCDCKQCIRTREGNHIKSRSPKKSKTIYYDKTVDTSKDGHTALYCELCNFKALSTRSLKSHMKRHSNDRHIVQKPLEQYKCTICGYLCTHLPSLKSHMWRHAGDTGYSYTVTNSTLNAAVNGENGVTMVKSTTNASFVFRCCRCGFESEEQSVLDKHMEIHVDPISYNVTRIV